MICKGKNINIFGTKIDVMLCWDNSHVLAICYEILQKTLIFMTVYLCGLGNKLMLIYSWACLGTLVFFLKKKQHTKHLS